jgi:AbrB family looped-hinge helix DNA binding protein
MQQSFISKVTSTGQVTLPKEIRKELGLHKDSYIVLDRRGRAVLIRKLDADKDTLEKIRAKIGKSALTRSRVQQLVEQVSGDVWEEKHSKSFRRP